LVGRPAEDGMSVAYARLCLGYVGAVCLRRGTVGLDDFSPAALGDAETLALARRLDVAADANPDPNALLPQRVELDLTDGRTVACDVRETLGSPARPLSRETARAKFDACCRSLPDRGAALWSAVAELETLADVGTVMFRAKRNPC
jgi:2-methylcitrate dehydratase PrpD